MFDFNIKLNSKQKLLLVWGSGWFLVAIALWLFSAIPWTFAYLEVGGLIGPVPLLGDTLPLLLFALVVSSVSFLTATKLMKNRRIRTRLFLNLFICLIVLSLAIFSFSIVFMPRVLQAAKKINTFVAENVSLSLQDYVTNVTSFLNKNVGAAYNKPEASFEIDRSISGTLLDPYIMNAWGVTRADLIVYQGWGSCGQTAILIGELLQRAGYQTRQAFFKGIDHQWAEVKYNGTWWIVDPWYIGNLVEAKNLKNIKPAFQIATGVEVQYGNGTMVDASLEHGY
jgi:hypothetical protein